MCTYSQFIADRERAEGKAEGITEGKAAGKAEGKAEDLLNLMANLKITIEQALSLLSIPEIEWPSYRKRVQELQS